MKAAVKMLIQAADQGLDLVLTFAQNHPEAAIGISIAVVAAGCKILLAMID